MSRSLALALILLASPSPAKKPAARAPVDPSEVVGVGLVVKIEGGVPVVDALVPGGPAARDGRLHPGDRIEAVAQGDEPWESTKRLRLEDVARRLRGARGTTVRLRAARLDDDGQRMQLAVELTREAFKKPREKK